MKTKVCIIYGGQSSEHKDSLDSFENIYGHLKAGEASPVFEITHIIFADLAGNAVINELDYNKPFNEYKTGTSVGLIEAFEFAKDKDLFLLSTLFSQNGEDGRLQGIASLMGIPTNLGEPLQPSLCISKFHLNQYVTCLIDELQVPETYRIKTLNDLEELWEKVNGQELVVKPNALGSSILTDKFSFTNAHQDKIKEEIRKILEQDTCALVQEYVKGEEYTCAVLKIDGVITALPVGQVMTERNFFGTPEKGSIALNQKRILDAEDPISVQAKLISKTLYDTIELNTVARFDYIYKEGQFYFLECNAFPSLHRYSFLMQMLHHDSKDILWLVENIVLNCIH